MEGFFPNCDCRMGAPLIVGRAGTSISSSVRRLLASACCEAAPNLGA